MTKMTSKIGLILALALPVFLGGNSFAAKEGEAKTTKSKYLIMSSHTPEQCLKALDEVKAQGDKTLAKYDWGCMAGDHTGYMEVMAANDADALNMVPASMRSTAKLVKLNKFTPAQIQSFHDKK